MRKSSFKKLFALVLMASALCLNAAQERTYRRVGSPQEVADSELLAKTRQPGDARAVTVSPQPRDLAGGGLVSDIVGPMTMSSMFKSKAHTTGSTPVNLKGFVTYSYTLSKGGYTIPQSPEESFEKFVSNVSPAYGGVATEDEFFCIRRVSPSYAVDTYDLHTWELKSTQQIPESLVPWALSYNPVDGKIYGNFHPSAGDDPEFGVVDYHELTRTTIATLDGAWWASGITSQGEMYAIHTDNNLYKVDITNGEMTLVGATGTTSSYFVSGVIDPLSDRFFYTTNTASFAGLYDIDLTTGEGTLLTELEGCSEVQGLFVDKPLASGGAPAAAYDLTVNVEGMELTGTLGFAVPAVNFDGSEGVGALHYAVSFNGDTLLEGETEYGAVEQMSFGVERSDLYNISVVLSNTTGESPAVSTSLYIGSDVPVMTKVELSRDGNQMNLKWQPVTESKYDAYFDASKVTYTIVRYPDAEVVAEGRSATTFSEALDYDGELAIFYYTVTAWLNDSYSSPAKSNSIILGVTPLPFEEGFDNPSSAQVFTIIDVNGDGRTWSYSTNGYMQYNYSVTNQADDWLILPPVRLTAGNTYKLSFDAWGHGGAYEEQFEVKCGTSAVPAEMTIEIMPSTDVLNASPKEYAVCFSPETDGDYSFGIHCTSPADDWNLFVDNLRVSQGIPETAPATVTELKVVPSYQGENSAVVSFVTPASAIDGSSLTSLSAVEVTRNKEVVFTIDNPDPGKFYSFTDEADESGVYIYSVRAANEFGFGLDESVESLLGVPYPTAPGLPSLSLNDSYGNVTLVWDAPLNDTYGNPLNPALVTYKVTNPKNGEVFIESTSETSATFRAVNEGERDFMQFTVTAMTATGSASTTSRLEAVGVPHDMPYTESFANGRVKYDLGVLNDGGEWELLTDSESMSSFDGDNGFIGMKGMVIGNSASLWTGKISLENTANPQLSFYVFNFFQTGSKNTNEIEVQVKCYDGSIQWVTLANTVVGDMGPAGWNRYSVSLKDYIGKVVSVKLNVTSQSSIYTFIDNLVINDQLKYNLALSSISLPVRAKVGKQFKAGVSVTNTGENDIDDYTVTLFCNGEAIAGKQCQAIAAGALAVTEFDVTLNHFAEDVAEFYATVSSEKDEKSGDDTSDVTAVAVTQSKLEKVNDLAAESDGSAVVLTWSEPDLDNETVETVTEDFEIADAWADNVDGWQFYDRDEAIVGGLQGIVLPGIPAGSTGSFWVFDASASIFDASFAANSGTKYMASIYRLDDKAADDWAVSPKLEGCAQTVTFAARSYSGDYPERVEVLASSAGNDTDDFTVIMSAQSVPASWTEFTVDLPDGTNYFAIRSIGGPSFFLFIDDVTYIPEPEMRGAHLLGYNVYRNGIKVNDSPVESTSYVDNEFVPSDRYTVTALYDRGESAPCSPVGITNGINDVEAAPATVRVVDRHIIIENVEGLNVAIHTADGRTVYSAVGTPRTSVAVTTGLYLVQTGAVTTKVVVK